MGSSTWAKSNNSRYYFREGICIALPILVWDPLSCTLYKAGLVCESSMFFSHDDHLRSRGPRIRVQANHMGCGRMV